MMKSIRPKYCWSFLFILFSILNVNGMEKTNRNENQLYNILTTQPDEIQFISDDVHTGCSGHYKLFPYYQKIPSNTASPISTKSVPGYTINKNPFTNDENSKWQITEIQPLPRNFKNIKTLGHIGSQRDEELITREKKQIAIQNIESQLKNELKVENKRNVHLLSKLKSMKNEIKNTHNFISRKNSICQGEQPILEFCNSQSTQATDNEDRLLESSEDENQNENEFEKKHKLLKNRSLRVENENQKEPEKILIEEIEYLKSILQEKKEKVEDLKNELKHQTEILTIKENQNFERKMMLKEQTNENKNLNDKLNCITEKQIEDKKNHTKKRYLKIVKLSSELTEFKNEHVSDVEKEKEIFHLFEKDKKITTLQEELKKLEILNSKLKYTLHGKKYVHDITKTETINLETKNENLNKGLNVQTQMLMNLKNNLTTQEKMFKSLHSKIKNITTEDFQNKSVQHSKINLATENLMNSATETTNSFQNKLEEYQKIAETTSLNRYKMKVKSNDLKMVTKYQKQELTTNQYNLEKEISSKDVLKKFKIYQSPKRQKENNTSMELNKTEDTTHEEKKITENNFLNNKKESNQISNKNWNEILKQHMSIIKSFLEKMETGYNNMFNKFQNNEKIEERLKENIDKIISGKGSELEKEENAYALVLMSQGATVYYEYLEKEINAIMVDNSLEKNITLDNIFFGHIGGDYKKIQLLRRILEDSIETEKKRLNKVLETIQNEENRKFLEKFCNDDESILYKFDGNYEYEFLLASYGGLKYIKSQHKMLQIQMKKK